ncbi:MAG: TonB-dependent receptor domain-containing protein [Nevskiales bacterium]
MAILGAASFAAPAQEHPADSKSKIESSQSSAPADAEPPSSGPGSTEVDAFIEQLTTDEASAPSPDGTPDADPGAAAEVAPSSPPPPVRASDTAEPDQNADLPQQAPAPSRPSSATVLEEIVVTATKREKSSREVPISIDAFNANELNERGAQGAQDALAYSPGVSVNQFYSPNLVNVQIRGTTANTVSVLGGPPTGVFLDDIPLTSPTSVGGNPNIDSFDLASVEVLKGPQGTLFGGSALAGALRSVPSTPELGEFGGHGFYSRTRVNESDDDGSDYGLALNVPIGETLALRGMATRRDYPGTVDNLRDGLPDVDNYRIEQQRVMLRWEPLDALSVQALVHDTSGAINDILFTDNTSRHERSSESGTSPSVFEYRISQLMAEYAFDSFSVIGSAAKVKKDDVLVFQEDRLLPTGQLPGLDAVVVQPFTAEIRANELRLVSSARTQSDWFLFDQWDWLIGLFDYRADQIFSASIQATLRPGQLLAPLLPVLPGLPLPSLPPIEALLTGATSLAQEQALYFDLTRYLGEKWELNLGGRLFRQENLGASATSSAGINIGSESATQKAKEFNPKFVVTWHLSEQAALRAAAVKGFRFGGVNLILDQDPNAPLLYDTDELWNYELGLRSEYLERRLLFDVTGFYVDWSRVQIAQRTFTGLSPYIDNVGSAVSKGVELQTRALLSAGFSLTLAGAYIDARTTAAFASQEGSIPAGTRMPGTPRVTASGILGYNRPLPRAVLDSSFTWSYQGEAFNDLAHRVAIPAYDVFGFNLGLSLPAVTGQPRLDLNIANLLDERTFNGAVVTTIGGKSTTDYLLIRPRAATLRLSLAF